MAEHTIRITAPDGWEPVGNPEGDSGWFHPNNEQIHRRYAVTFRRAWQWPPWLKAAAIAMDADGKWCAYENVPTIYDAFDRVWSPNGDCTELTDRLFDFTPPPCDDWTKSMRKNPNIKE